MDLASSLACSIAISDSPAVIENLVSLAMKLETFGPVLDAVCQFQKMTGPNRSKIKLGLDVKRQWGVRLPEAMSRLNSNLCWRV